MITTEEILMAVERIGGRLEPAGDMLRTKLPKKCPPELKEAIRINKPKLLIRLALQKQTSGKYGKPPPSDLQLNPTQPNPGTDDSRSIMEYIVRQIHLGPNALCEWCLRREYAYWEVYQWPDEVCALAAARDAACWQLDMEEGAVRKYLINRELAVN